MTKKLIVITGPTASGKTALSVAVAQALNCPIVSADSRQFYKELNIGTAKPTKEEMMGVPHYFVDSHSIQNPITSGQFEKDALALLEEQFKSNNTIVMTGGSGMFLKAVTHGTDQLPRNESVRDKWNAIYEKEGIDFLVNKIKELDPNALKNVDIRNPIRLIRIIELLETTGKKIAELRINKSVKRSFDSNYFIIDHEREVLYGRINKRVDLMITQGLVAEVEKLKEFKSLQALNTVGYKEVFDYLEGKHDKERAVELIKRNTRRYAKRQLTWFRGIEDAIWIKYTTLNEMKNKVIQYLNS